MTDPILDQLPLEKYGYLLGGLLRGKWGAALLDGDGKRVWSAGAAAGPEIERLLTVATAEDAPGSSQLLPLGERGVVCVGPVASEESVPVGSLAIWLEHTSPEESGGDAERLSEVQPRIATYIANEYRLNDELSSATTELAERYEELNLVYGFEAFRPQDDRGAVPVSALLAGFTDRLPVAVAMFVSPEHGAPVYTTGNRSLCNLDLLLTEMRGKLFRFACAARNTFAINDADDPRRHFLLTGMPFKVLVCPAESCRSVGSALILLRHMDDPDFLHGDINLAKVFVGRIELMLSNQAMARRLRRFTEQMAASLVEAVEAKDVYTRGHSERVEQVAEGIGRTLEFSEADLEDLFWGALLHDIGKIGIPDAILNKPGRLTADEFTFIKTHPERSYEILRHIEAIGEKALSGARYHQERFDGAGYPFGLRGAEIPLTARVIAVADTYDAITSSRSYRAALGHEKALEIIQACAGSQLDPEIVRVFLERTGADESWLRRVRVDRGGSDD